MINMLDISLAAFPTLLFCSVSVAVTQLQSQNPPVRHIGPHVRFLRSQFRT